MSDIKSKILAFYDALDQPTKNRPCRHPHRIGLRGREAERGRGNGLAYRR